MKRYGAMALWILALFLGWLAVAQSAMVANISQREYSKFIETSGGDTALRVVLSDGSSSGLATLAEQQAQTDLLVDVNGHLVTLEAYLDGVESSLDDLNANLLSLKSEAHGDSLSLQGKVDATNSNLNSFQAANHADLQGVQVRQDTLGLTLTGFRADNRSDLQGVHARQDAHGVTLTGIRTDLSGVQTRLDTANSNLVTVHGKQDAQTAELTAINGSTDGLEGLATSTNTKLDSVNSNLATVQSKQDLGNASLSQIDADLDVALSTRASELTLSNFKGDSHTDLLGVQARLDTVGQTQTAFRAANHEDLQGVQVRLDAASAAVTDTATRVSAFQAQNHTDLLGVQVRVDATAAAVTDTANRVTLASTANHTDVLGVQVRIDANGQTLTGIRNSLLPSALTVKQAAIEVSTTPVRLTTDGLAPSSTRILVVGVPDPNSSANFYVGSSSVATSGDNRGIPIIAGERFITNNDAADYYIISDTASQTVFVLEQE